MYGVRQKQQRTDRESLFTVFLGYNRGDTMQCQIPTLAGAGGL